MSVHVIVFSKDRPLQLHGYLTSLFAHWHGALTVDVCVRIEETYDGAYGEVVRQFMSHDARFHGDEEVQGFAAQLQEIVASSDAPFTVFGVDDAVWVRDVDGEAVERAFAHRLLLGYSLRLGHNIKSNLWVGELAQPVFQTVEGSLCWDVAAPDSKGDWAYPWEIVGTVYPTDYVRAMVKMLVAQGRCNNPSQLEDAGSVRWSKHTSHREMACPSISAVVLPAPNRVQDEFNNPLLGPELSTEFLLECWEHGLRLDHESFGRRVNTQIHVPDFFLRRAM